MNRTLYQAGIILYSIVFLLTALQAGVWEVNRPFFNSRAYTNWLVIGMTIHLAADLVLMKYLHFKKYRTSFTIMIIHLITYHFYFFSELGKADVWMQNTFWYLTVGTAGLFDLSLIFSAASERPLLKMAGKLGLCLVILLLINFTLIMFSQNSLNLDLMYETLTWASWSGVLLLLFFILNFSEELKKQSLVATAT